MKPVKGVQVMFVKDPNRPRDVKQKEINQDVHARVIRRVVERYRATPSPSAEILSLLLMFEQEYSAIDQITHLDE